MAVWRLDGGLKPRPDENYNPKAGKNAYAHRHELPEGPYRHTHQTLEIGPYDTSSHMKIKELSRRLRRRRNGPRQFERTTNDHRLRQHREEHVDLWLRLLSHQRQR